MRFARNLYFAALAGIALTFSAGLYLIATHGEPGIALLTPAPQLITLLLLGATYRYARTLNRSRLESGALTAATLIPFALIAVAAYLIYRGNRLSPVLDTPHP